MLGQVADTLEDVWIQVALGEVERAKKYRQRAKAAPFRSISGNNYPTAAFIAPTGVAAMLTGHQSWLNATFADASTRREQYYEDSISLLSMLVMSGNAWLPGQSFASEANYAAWAASSGLPANQQDPSDRNGSFRLPNLITYALDRTPATVISEDLPAPSVNHPQLEVAHRYNPEAVDIGYYYDFLTPENTWDAIEPTDVRTDPDDPNRRIVSFDIPVSGKLLVRLRVKWNP